MNFDHWNNSSQRITGDGTDIILRNIEQPLDKKLSQYQAQSCGIQPQSISEIWILYHHITKLGKVLHLNIFGWKECHI